MADDQRRVAPYRKRVTAKKAASSAGLMGLALALASGIVAAMAGDGVVLTVLTALKIRPELVVPIAMVVGAGLTAANNWLKNHEGVDYERREGPRAVRPGWNETKERHAAWCPQRDAANNLGLPCRCGPRDL